MTPFLTGPLPVPHGFFTREGGVSSGEFATLNAARNGDEPANVEENRRRAVAALGTPARLVTVRQVHGIAVRIVTGEEAAGDADALVTDRPGVTLGIVTADCAPVLFASGDGRVVGAAHAGWRGAVLGVLEATVIAMRALGAERIGAVVGPCIQRASYEVGPDLRDAVLAALPGASRFFDPGDRDRLRFDLPGYCLHRLAADGVTATSLGADTLSDPRFFSNRRRTRAVAADGVARALGHQISMVALGLTSPSPEGRGPG